MNASMAPVQPELRARGQRSALVTDIWQLWGGWFMSKRGPVLASCEGDRLGRGRVEMRVLGFRHRKLNFNTVRGSGAAGPWAA